MGYKIVGWGTAVFFLIITLLTACSVPTADELVGDETAVSPTQEAIEVNLPDLGVAPEFRNNVWLNSDVPVTLADQRGKVVLLEFWTFG
ncbi:MAG: hypothetical protein H6654_17070 [Ardenticatenaceae bacterium]|nr:hypothetical protein [Anaerolineales bacterium]MCB8938416.1 hypothetical protein [Ardenticatenaceae bacterium]MCB8975274.1 hypothetical protein [Ardenticatenaceae bacterium]